MQPVITLLQAQQGNSGISMIIMIVIMFAIMWFFIMRPQQKQQKKLQEFRKSIEKGTEVITAGGIYGIVRDKDEVNNILIVEVASGVRLRVSRDSVFSTTSGSEAGYQKQA